MDNQIIFYFSLLLIIGVLGKNERIIGGDDTSIQEFPFMVAIKIHFINNLVCAGTIISSTHILSAAHCIYGNRGYMSFLRVYTGVTELSEMVSPGYRVKDCHVHPEFEGKLLSSTRHHNDIAIFTLFREIKFNLFQNKVELPTENSVNSGDVVLVGWGVTTWPHGYFSDKLQKVTVKLMDYFECITKIPHVVREDQLCTFSENRNMAIGDSGGPVLKNGKIIGVMSFSHPINEMIPQIHCNVFIHLDFIRSVIEI